MYNKLYALLLAGCSLSLQAHSQTPISPDSKSDVKNVIIVIGDGMGPAYTSGYRYFSDDVTTAEIETTVFDRLMVGMSSTYPEDNTVITDSAAAARALSTGTKTANMRFQRLVTDSAASATALSTGEKSYNGAIGLDNDLSPLPTMFEIAKQRDLLTALVVTSQVNHATPASFVAHVEKRGQYNDIADQYLENRIDNKHVVDIIFGGGVKYFKREDRDLVSEFEQQGFHYIERLQDLDEIQSLPTLGLFSPKGMPYALDSTDKHRLNTMTSKALELLNTQDKGFVLLVEGSQIDWCGHDNDIACAMAEMDDFAKTIETLEAFVASRDDTLLVMTADHNTGGLSLGANSEYNWNVASIKGIQASLPVLTEKLLPSDNLEKDASALLGWSLTPKQATKLKQAQQQNEEALYDALRDVINAQTLTGWTTRGHTADDVQVFATGAKAHLFAGYQDNTDIAKKLIEIISKQ